MKPLILRITLGISVLFSSTGIAENPPNAQKDLMNPAPKIENAIPVLPVRDLQRSITF